MNKSDYTWIEQQQNSKKDTYNDTQVSPHAL